MSDTCPRCEYTGIMMALNDGSTTRFCECGFIFHYCVVHDTIVQNRGPSNATHCSCASALICSCLSPVKVLQPGVLFCQACNRHFTWAANRGLYVANN